MHTAQITRNWKHRLVLIENSELCLKMSNRVSIIYVACAFLLSLLIASTGVDAQTTQCPARMPGSPSNHRNHLRVKQQTEERIVGGNEATPNSYPWMVYLKINMWNGETLPCGGTLISEDWILTASHCTLGALSATAILGAHDVTAGSSDQHQISLYINLYPQSEQIIIYYPGYNYSNVEGDIALIRLPQAVPISQYISPARLPYSDDPDQINDPVTLLGWGNYTSNGYGNTSRKLRQVDTKVIDYNTCQQNSNVETFSNEKIICGDGSDGRRYCYGDDGGPMADYREDESQWFVIGVAWFGDKTSTCQSSHKPNIYARVSYYADWIYNKTGIPPAVRPTTTTSTTRPNTTKVPSGVDCRGKTDGLYPVPNETCTKYFYYCSNEMDYLYECPANTVFYYKTCNCEYPELVPECN